MAPQRSGGFRLPERETILAKAGITPSVSEVLRVTLGEAVAEATVHAAVRGAAGITALDAGCGRHSALVKHREAIDRFVGIDVHEPPPGALPHLDEFVVVDVCRPSEAFDANTFDVVLSSFTVEHFDDPGTAFANLRRWLRPGGAIVLTTVNRRHPFVAAYLGLPERVRNRLQRLLKASPADAHPLVGGCNEPTALRSALETAGFTAIEIAPVGHLARAWRRHRATFVLGLIGDVLANRLPSRRSTLVVSARVPLDGPGSPA